MYEKIENDEFNEFINRYSLYENYKIQIIILILFFTLKIPEKNKSFIFTIENYFKIFDSC